MSEKLSQITSGGAAVPATDQFVTVRSGSTDVLTTVGTAAPKAASDVTKAAVASVSGAITATHVAVFADGSGTIQDGGTLGTASGQASSSITGTVAAVNGGTVVGHIATFTDTAGTIHDGGYVAAHSGANTDITSVLLNNTGLGLKDQAGTHTLTIADAETLTGPKTLSFITGNFDRTITLTGNTSLAGTNTGDQFTSVTASRLLGNPTGSPAAASEIILGTNLSFTGTTLNASAGSSSPSSLSFILSPGFGSLGGAGTLLQYVGNNAIGSSSFPSSQVVPDSGTLSNLYIQCDQVPGGSVNRTFTVYKNGVATALTCVTGPAALTANDVTHTVSFVAGDVLAVSCQDSANSSTSSGMLASCKVVFN